MTNNAIYINAKDDDGNMIRKTARGWEGHMARLGKAKGNSQSAIAKRYIKKKYNGLSNRQIVGFDDICHPLKTAAKLKPSQHRNTMKKYDSNNLVAEFLSKPLTKQVIV